MTLRKMLGELDKKEFKIALEYYHQITMSKESSENAITYFMDYHVIPFKPILDDMDTLKEHNIDVAFAYGDDDWLDTEFEGIKISKELKDLGYNVDIISNSKHNLYMCNYQELILRLNQRLETL